MASTYTVLNLVKRAMRLLKVINIGSDPTADEGQDSLDALNGMVDAWAILRLMIYTVARQVFATNGGQQQYLIGPEGPDWIAERPVYIERAGLIYGAGPDLYERNIKVLTPKEWQQETSKGLSTTVVTKLYYDSGYSNPNSSTTPHGSGTVFVWPIPIDVSDIALYVPQAVSEFTSLNQPIALPPGYKRALAYNLALELAPEFDVTPSQVVVAIALDSMTQIQSANLHLNKLSCDPAMLRRHSGRPGAFNIYVGE